MLVSVYHGPVKHMEGIIILIFTKLHYVSSGTFSGRMKKLRYTEA